MNNANRHTPGPWEAAGARVGKSKYGEIAECFGTDFEANALLIAASPELLQIAEELSDWELDPDRYAGDIADLAHKARAIIAKAKRAI
jgi:hypothetical protein